MVFVFIFGFIYSIFVVFCPQHKANAKAVDHEGRTCLQHVRAAVAGGRNGSPSSAAQDAGPLTELLVQNGCLETGPGTSTLTRPLDILPSSVI